MNRWFVLFVMGMVMLLTGCGSGVTEGLPSNYIGVFKSIRTNNDRTVVVTITTDNGIEYGGLIDTIPIEGKWGELGGDSLGLVSYQLDKGNDTNFFDFYLSIAGSVVSGTVLRQ